jgi:predicted amidohydrolase
MAQPLRLALAQLDLVVGDIAGNEAHLRDYLGRAREAGAQLVVFPELAVTGYPPEDLLLKRHFLADARGALDRIAADAHEIVAVIGYPELAEDVYNATAVLADGAVQASYRKVFLPNYGVFDEQRYFRPGVCGGVIDLDGVRVGLTVCEDCWEPGPPLTDEALAGATLILNASASPYHAGKGHDRELMFAQRARDSLAVVAYCNLVGGQDELVFDGHSLVVDHRGRTLARAAQFAEEMLVVDVDLEAPAAERLRDARNRAAARRGGGREHEHHRSASALRAAPGHEHARHAEQRHREQIQRSERAEIGIARAEDRADGVGGRDENRHDRAQSEQRGDEHGHGERVPFASRGAREQHERHGRAGEGGDTAQRRQHRKPARLVRRQQRVREQHVLVLEDGEQQEGENDLDRVGPRHRLIELRLRRLP